MGLFRPARHDGRADRFLRAKVLIFTAGAAAALAGLATGRGWLVGLAIAILAAGVLLRALGRRA